MPYKWGAAGRKRSAGVYVKEIKMSSKVYVENVKVQTGLIIGAERRLVSVSGFLVIRGREGCTKG